MRLNEIIKKSAFIILFSWVSFFPAPLEQRYGAWVRVFLAAFLLFLIMDKKYSKAILNIKDWPLWLFLVSLAAGTLSAANRAVAGNTYLYLAITFFLLFHIGKGLFRDAKIMRTVSVVICVCAVLVAITALLEVYFKKNILYEGLIVNPYYARYIQSNPPRPMSTQFNPVILGSYLLGCLPFSFYLLRQGSRSLRLTGLISCLLSIAIIMLVFSRGVLLGFIALVLFYLWNRRKIKLILFIFFCLILLVALSSYQKNTNLCRFGFNRLITGSYDSVISPYRTERIRMAFAMLKEKPLTGIGFNHFRLRFNEYCPAQYEGKVPYEFMIADNMYLTLAAESGLIGISGFLIFIYFLFKRAFAELKKIKDKERKLALLISLSALSGLLVNMAAYELFYWDSPYMLFCLFCGFIQALSLSGQGKA